MLWYEADSAGNQCTRYPQAQSIRYRHRTWYRPDTQEESTQDQGKLIGVSPAIEADEEGSFRGEAIQSLLWQLS